MSKNADSHLKTLFFSDKITPERMKRNNHSMVFLLILQLWAGIQLHSEKSPDFEVRRLSPRVMVFTGVTEMHNNVVVLNSLKGLVVIDTSGDPVVAGKIRDCSEREFAGKAFIHVINTHHHWDHVRGNAAFSDVPTIIHANGEQALLPRPLTAKTKNPEHLPPAARSGPYQDTAPPPIITFSDRLTLDLGDLTLVLFYFGRAHSPGDTLILAEEEGLLLTGDVFLDRNWLPLFWEQVTLDIPRWLNVLSSVLDERNRLKTVVPGHMDFWMPEKLDLWRNYISELWQGTNKCRKDGMKFEEVIGHLPLPEKLLYLKEVGHSEARILEFHRRNIQAFWTQLFESAAAEVKQVLISQGVKVARETFNRIKSSKNDRYIINERQFNMAGYELLMDGRINEAIALFQLNIETFPDSWKANDSLAEAYMMKGDKEKAVKYCRKSLALNPDNRHARRILQRLEKE